MTVLQQDVAFLEHFGVKGMRWGVRKERKRTKEEAAAKLRKRRIKIGAKAGVVLGASVVAVVLLHKGAANLGAARHSKTSSRGMDSVSRVLRNSGQTKMSNIPKKPVTPRVNPEHKAFIKAFNERQTAINRAANVSLRAKDNELNIPIHLRSYLPDWN